MKKKALLASLALSLISSSLAVTSTAKLRPLDSPLDSTAEVLQAHERRGLENVDVRRNPVTLEVNGAAAFTGKRAPVDRTAAIDALIAEAPLADPDDLVVDLHGSGIPKSVVNLGGVLSGARSGSADAIARGFLAEHSALFGLSPDDVRNLRVTMDNLDETTGVTYMKYEQTVGGLPVYDSEIGVTITAHGEIAIVNQGQTIPNAVVSTDAALTPERAVAKAFEHCGVEVSADAVRPSAAKRDEASEFVSYENPLGGRRRDVLSQKTIVSVNGGAVLAYRTIVPKDGGETYDTLVDANTGELLVRADMAHDVAGQVFKRSPTQGRTLEQFTPLFGVADPWISSGTLTLGNNVGSLLDLDGNDFSEYAATTGATGANAGLTSGLADSTKGSPVGQFSYAWSAAAAPNTQQAASVTNVFYLCNVMHDWMYSLGFTESARNLQLNNYGRGGSGYDYVIANVQDASSPGTSSFTATPDGLYPILQVGVFNTSAGLRDAGLDGDVVLHEYGHGVSSRLIGNGSGLSGTQSSALGEGWSDYWAISNYNDGLFGEYASGNSTAGLRRAKYTVPAYELQSSYAYLGWQGFEPHKDGEIWAAALWEIYTTLGKAKTDKIVLDGMKNTPTSPSFVNARSGVITACQALYPSDVCTLWAIFARHGLGAAASGNDGTTRVASYSIPASCGGGSTCTPTAMSAAVMAPKTIAGTLAQTDCMTTPGTGTSASYADRYTYAASAGQILTISQIASAFGSYVRLKNASGTVVASKATYASNVPSTVVYTVTSNETFTIETTSYQPLTTGAYTLTLTISNAPGSACWLAVFGGNPSSPIVVDRAGTHVVWLNVVGNATLQRWNGSGWATVYVFNGDPSPGQGNGYYDAGPGTYRWIGWQPFGERPAEFCYSWP